MSLSRRLADNENAYQHLWCYISHGRHLARAVFNNKAFSASILSPQNRHGRLYKNALILREMPPPRHFRRRQCHLLSRAKMTMIFFKRR